VTGNFSLVIQAIDVDKIHCSKELLCQVLRILGEDGPDKGISPDSALVKSCQSLYPFWDRGGARFEEFPDIIIISGDGQSHLAMLKAAEEIHISGH
jgi:hypothetical protein